MNDIAHLAGIRKRMVVAFPFELHVRVRLVHFVYKQNEKGNVSYQRHFLASALDSHCGEILWTQVLILPNLTIIPFSLDFLTCNVNVGCLLFGPIRLNLLPADPQRGLSGLLQLPSILLYGLLDSKLQSTSSSAQLSTWSISCSVLISTARHGYPRGWKGCKIDNLLK